MLVRRIQELSQFQGGNSCNSKHDSYNPESGDDFSFGIVFFLVVMMKWTHQENASALALLFPSVFEVAHLDDYTKVLYKEDSSNYGK